MRTLPIVLASLLSGSLVAAPPPAAGAGDLTCDGLPVTIDLYDSEAPDPDRPESDVVRGTLAGDIIWTGAGDDVICAGRGADLIDPGAGDDVVLAGKGVDTLILWEATSAVTVDLRSTEARATGLGSDVVRGFEDVQGSDHHPNYLIGTAAPNEMVGGNADDVIESRGGDDRVHVGDGDDEVSLGRGSDYTRAGADDDRVRGGGGDDWLDADGYDWTGQRWETGDDVVEGGAGNDYVLGALGTDEVHGGGGDDVLQAAGGAGGGRERMYGGAGADHFWTSSRDELIAGGDGVDTVAYDGDHDRQLGVTVDLRITRPQDTRASGTDQILGVENLTGSYFDDVLHGDDGPNAMWGGYGGTDTIDAHGGHDVCTEDPLDSFAGCEEFVPFVWPRASYPRLLRGDPADAVGIR